ncbi:unnamed protein product, partial [marine sediment metagenome]
HLERRLHCLEEDAIYTISLFSELCLRLDVYVTCALMDSIADKIINEFNNG